MVIGYPDVSKDFPKLIKTLSSLNDNFDYWDDFVVKIYENANNPKFELQSYFRNVDWVHLDKPYPTCPELEDDWMFVKNRYVTHIQETTFKVNQEKLSSSPLREYVEDKKLPNLIS